MTQLGVNAYENLQRKLDIDTEWVQGLQDYYSELAHLYLFLLDDEGRQVTTFTGDPAMTARMQAIVTPDHVAQIFNRLMGSPTEEQVIEDTDYSNVKLAGIAIRVEGAAELCWIVAAVIEGIDDEESLLNAGHKISKKRFLDSLDFLRLISTKVYINKYIGADALAESVRSRSAELQMLHDLRKSEVMTDIVSLLDSDESFEEICEQMVRYVGAYSDIAHAYVLRPNVSGSGVDVLGEYLKEGYSPLRGVANTDDIIKYMKIVGDKPLVVSYKTKLEQEERDWLTSLGLTSCVVLPVFTSKPNRQVAMYVVFVDDLDGRMWDRDEIKFFGDAERIIQSILEKRIQKNSLASSYKSLESILDNVGTAIYVRDIESGQILFANRMFKDSFTTEMEDGTVEKLFERELRYSAGTSYYEVEYLAKR